MRRASTLAMLAMVAACPPGEPAKPELAASGPRLPPPRAIDPGARGAAYLTAIAAQIQPAWGQFLEDCRLRLPKTHPLNQPALIAIAHLWIARDGRLVVRIATGSGNGDFDTAVFDVASDAGPFPPPPADLISDDDAAHVQWTFARDARQAGPATASVIDVKLPLLAFTERVIEAKAIDRALVRIIGAPGDPDRLAATERVMIAMLREGLYSQHGAARRSAVEAIARADIGVLTREVHALAGPIPDLDLRVAAITASAQLRDPAIADTLARDLADDLANRPRVGLAKIDALVALRRAPLAAPAIRAALAAGPAPTALLALAKVPDPEIAVKLRGWIASGDAKTRAAVCAALPAAAPPDQAAILIAKGLRDADASVRAKCSDAAARHTRPPDALVAKRLRELGRDRDRAVRARAIAALGALEPGHKLRAITDPAAEIRLASLVGASEPELRTLVSDPDPEVRAAALSALGDRAPEVATRAVADPAAAVRRAAIATLADDVALERLVHDASPEVATAATIRLAARRGRSTETGPMLATLQVAPPGSPVRVRIALAWLLAR